LRRLAAHELAQEKPGQTLSAAALAHKAYLRLVGPGTLETCPTERPAPITGAWLRGGFGHGLRYAPCP
jgi:hypothetical protein